MVLEPSLDIIIVNWNSAGQLRACLESVDSASRFGYALGRVVVVDNASSDGSADELHYPGLPLTLIRNAENRGFAAACNQGAQGSPAEYLLFLNPDVALFRDSLARPIQFMRQPENVGVGICSIQLVDQQGCVVRNCARFPTLGGFYSKMLGLDRLSPRLFPSPWLRESDHRESREVDQTIGAFLLIRRSLFEELSGFDERFFVYFEDVDLAYRSYRAGWRSSYLTTAQAYHRGEGCSSQEKAARLLYSLRSRILYGFKHFGWVAATALLLGTILFEPFPRVALAARRGSLREVEDTLRGYFNLWRTVPALLSNLKALRKA